MFQLYRGGQFYWLATPEYQEKTADLSQVNDKVGAQYHCNCIKTFDLSTLYASLSHDQMKCTLNELIQHYFLKKNREQGYRQCRISLYFRLDRLKPRASKFKEHPVQVYNIFNIVIGISHL